MTDTNSRMTSTGYAHTTGHSESEGSMLQFELPEDVATLIAMREAIDTKIQALQTTGVAALRDKFAAEVAALGVTTEDVLGIAGKKRGRKPRSKRDE